MSLLLSTFGHFENDLLHNEIIIISNNKEAQEVIEEKHVVEKNIKGVQFKLEVHNILNSSPAQTSESWMRLP